MHIQIIGAGLSGLVCAHSILDIEEKATITIYESRPEVGYPQHKPGIVNEFHKHQEKLFEWGISELSRCYSINGKGGLHRPQLEKDLSIKLVQRKVDILLKTIVEGAEVNQDGNIIVKSSGAGLVIPSKPTAIIIDTIGEQSPISSIQQRIFLPFKPSLKWVGGISISENIPGAVKWSGKRLDGTIECWYPRDEMDYNYDWLSIMEGEFPEEEASIDSAIKQGITLASLTLERI